MLIKQILSADNYWLKITDYDRCDKANNLFTTKTSFIKIVAWALVVTYESDEKVLPMTIAEDQEVIINFQEDMNNYFMGKIIQCMQIIFSQSDLSKKIFYSDATEPFSL